MTSPFRWPAQGQRGGVAARVALIEEQIIAILKEAEAGIAPDELCRGTGSHAGACTVEGEAHGDEVSEARRLRQLEEETGS